jgi:hypothetical protein
MRSQAGAWEREEAGRRGARAALQLVTKLQLGNATWEALASQQWFESPSGSLGKCAPKLELGSERKLELGSDRHV